MHAYGEIAERLRRSTVQIFNADSCEQSINLAQLLTGLRVVKFHTQHFNRLRREGGVKVFNLRSNTILGKGVLDLTGHVAIDIAQAVDNKD